MFISTPLNAIPTFRGTQLAQELSTRNKTLAQPQNLLERQRQSIQFKIDKLQDRIKEAYLMAEMAEKYLKEGSLVDVVRSVEEKYPYQLNNQKKND